MFGNSHLRKPREGSRAKVNLEARGTLRGSKVDGLGFRVQGLGFRVQGLGFRVQGLGFRV